ncbi:LOB domain-containing protein 42 [Raphanus sativus]|nr:LOB domain-containing protein 42 [Raphanus sativus]
MRISCNGCRVLRKGCNQDCTIRPCLQWIKSADSQANATLFLAKFYGRAGLLNLIESGPDHLRPGTTPKAESSNDLSYSQYFRSLLYEACGRIVNPVDGSVGLMWSGNWAQCQAAVDAILNGLPITHTPLPSASASHQIIPPHRTYDIRHVAKIQQQAVTVRRVWPLPHVSTSRHVGNSRVLVQRMAMVSWRWRTWQIEGRSINQSSNLGCDDQVDTNEVGLELRLG